MQYKGKTLTPEQSAGAELITSGKDCKIIAPAGAGKTLSLLAGSRRTTASGLNLSFNKAIAQSAAKKFSHNIDCRTSHSLAFRSLGKYYSKRLKKLTGKALATSFDIGKPGHFGTPAYKAYNILDTIRRFCYSSDSEITIAHTPKLKINASTDLMHRLRSNLAHYAGQLWAEMSSRKSQIPITHDFYLKLWALSEPDLQTDFIIFDEAQDANPVIVNLLLKQSSHSQLIFAGDPFQQIYSWRGAINALQTLDFQPAYLTKSFRFGQAIADIATNIIYSYHDPSNRMPAIQGNENIDSKITSHYDRPDCIICRTNKGVIAELLGVLESNLTPYIMGGTDNLIKLINGIKALKYGHKAFHPDLALFQTYDDLIEYAESDMGGDMAMILSLIKSYGYQNLLSALSSTSPEPAQADITITTTHKAKGLEWPIVKLSNDFKFPSEPDTIILAEEANLLYVAATRALNVLDISSCEALSNEALYCGQRYWEKIEDNFKSLIHKESKEYYHQYIKEY